MCCSDIFMVESEEFLSERGRMNNTYNYADDQLRKVWLSGVFWMNHCISVSDCQ